MLYSSDFITNITERYEKYVDLLDNSIHNVVDNFDELSNYEKRRIIFDVICNVHTFDVNNLYDKILDHLYLDSLRIFKSKKENNPYFLEYNEDNKNFDNNKNFMSYYLENRDTTKQMLEIFLKEHNCYSIELFDKLVDRIESGEFNFDPDIYKETINLINKQVLCEGCASLLYKNLLDKNGIYSLRVICDNSFAKEHAINLVFDEDTGYYSFDDIESNILHIGSAEDCFDYDLESAIKLGQGTREPDFFAGKCEGNKFGVALSSSVNGILIDDGSKSEWYRSFGIEKAMGEDGYDGLAYQLPKNIKSIKSLKEDNNTSVK